MVTNRLESGILRTEGIVLNEMRFKETSKILNIYTKKFGRISVMAKGAYRAKSKLIAHTQPFSYSEYQLYKGRSFYYINEASVIESFYDIRERIERVVCGFYILELLNRSTPEEEPNEVLFLLLEKSLTILSGLNDDFLKFIIAFELKYISFLGYRPYIERCVSCGSKELSNIKFSISEGGIICDNCFTVDSKAKKIDRDMYIGICQLLYIELDKLSSVNIPRESLIGIQDILEDYILYNIDRSDFNSLNLLKSIINI